MITRFEVPLLQHIAKRVEEQRAERAESIVRGNAPDHAEYRYQAGFIAGLEAVLEIARDVERALDGGAPLERR